MLTVTKISPLKNSRLQIDFDDGTEVIVREDAFVKNPLRKDQELDIDELRQFLETALHGDCRYKALDYISRRFHASGELKKKLIDKEFPKHLCEKVIFELEEEGFINDREFARMYIDEKLNRGKGLSRIKQELRQRGIDRELLSELIEELHDDIQISERENAEIQAKKKWKTFKADIPLQKRREKLYRFLASRGFPSYIISQIIQKIVREDDNEDPIFY